MKTSIQLLLLTSLLAAAAAGPAGADGSPAAPALQTPLPRDIPQASLVFDEPGDGLLWVRGATYKASFGPDGMTYVPFLGSQAPRNQPLHMSLRSARVGQRELPLSARASWSRAGDVVTLERGAVDVQYVLALDSIEQLFLVDPIVPDGDLVVELDMDSELERRASAAGFEWSAELGGVRYGSATALDASGRSLALESRGEERGLSIHVPRSFLAEASQPLVIDPVISTFSIDSGPVATWSGEVSYDETNDLFLYTYTYLYSQSDYDVYSLPMESDGTQRHDLGRWIDISAADWRFPSVANNQAADNFLIVVEATYAGVSQIYGRIRQLPGTELGPVIQISANGTGECRLPSVGGDSSGGSANRYCVAWVEEISASNKDVLYRMIRADGSSASTVLALDASANTEDWRPKVSSSNGSGLSGERCWNVVWMRPNGPESDIIGAQVAPNGFLITPSFYVDSTNTDHGFPTVTPPLDSASGGPRDFLAVYTAHVGNRNDLHARLFKGNDYIASFDLTALEAAATGENLSFSTHNWPAVATFGAQIVLTYSEYQLAGDASAVYLSTFHHNGDDLFVSDARVLLASEASETVSLSDLATAHDGGAADSRLVAVNWGVSAGSDANTMGAIYQTPSGWTQLGDAICAGMPNTTGFAATFRAYGSAQPGVNRLFLDVDNLPHFQHGEFLMSSQAGVMPFGDGFLCLAAPHVRLNSTLGNSWTSGALGAQLDLSALPGGLQLHQGETWYFQFWYRDTGSFNLSNALAIQFQ